VSPNDTLESEGVNQNVTCHFLFIYKLNFNTKSPEKAMFLPNVNCHVTMGEGGVGTMPGREGVHTKSQKCHVLFIWPSKEINIFTLPLAKDFQKT